MSVDPTHKGRRICKAHNTWNSQCETCHQCVGMDDTKEFTAFTSNMQVTLDSQWASLPRPPHQKIAFRGNICCWSSKIKPGIGTNQEQHQVIGKWNAVTSYCTSVSHNFKASVHSWIITCTCKFCLDISVQLQVSLID